MRIGERIAVLLKAQNKTMTDLADFLGVREQTVDVWCRVTDETIPDNLIERIAGFFDVSPKLLLTGETDAKTDENDVGF